MSVRCFACVLAGLLLAGCASSIPEPIRDPEDGGPSLAAVRADPDAHLGKTIRWGGEIVEVENRPEHTEMQVVAKPLEYDARPADRDRSEGRFLVRFPGFLDPAVYAPGRRITVTGTVEEMLTRDIGEYAYRLPLVEGDGSYLWTREEDRPRPYRDPWHDPWYRYHDPWYPYPHPYYPYW
ncbi:MAG: Slp family lipoprotein [Thiohalorhabdus sp.]|uniref:Slp family lipoprotein n=1 Tax=Thiohalorhabdus sp. TaxID=3094134 RepID=UPI003980ABD3